MVVKSNKKETKNFSNSRKLINMLFLTSTEVTFKDTTPKKTFTLIKKLDQTYISGGGGGTCYQLRFIEKF